VFLGTIGCQKRKTQKMVQQEKSPISTVTLILSSSSSAQTRNGRYDSIIPNFFCLVSHSPLFVRVLLTKSSNHSSPIHSHAVRFCRYSWFVRFRKFHVNSCVPNTLKYPNSVLANWYAVLFLLHELCYFGHMVISILLPPSCIFQISCLSEVLLKYLFQPCKSNITTKHFLALLDRIVFVNTKNLNHEFSTLILEDLIHMSHHLPMD
jgi:hypothetical protein